MRVAAVQMTASPDREANLRAADGLVAEAAGAGAHLVVLPELFAAAGSPAHLRAHAEDLGGPTLTWARRVGDAHGLHLVAGTIPERADDGAIHNTSCLVGPDGSLTVAYRKIHLFDVRLAGLEVSESATFAPGSELCVAPLERAGGHPAASPGPRPRAVVGLSVCYDLRFPELYRALAGSGATVVTVPAAFTGATGPAHWEVLLRARAIENQVFVVAAGQEGELPRGMPACFGHSLVVDPWGTVLAERSTPGPGVVVADLDLVRQAQLRADLPVLAQRRPDAYVVADAAAEGRRDQPRRNGSGGVDQRSHRAPRTGALDRADGRAR